MGRRRCAALMLWLATAHGGLAGSQETFRRVLFEASVPLGEEAPHVAAQGNLVAFGAGHEIKVFDVRRQNVTFTCSLVPGAQGPSLAYEARVLGIFENTVYACVRHFADPERLDPGGKWGRVGGGAEPGEFKVVAVRIGEKEVRPIAPLGSEVTLAEGLLGTSLPFVDGNSLSLLSLENGTIRTMTLPGPAVDRPVVRDGQLVGRYEGGAYLLTANQAAPRCVSFADTPLERLEETDAFAICGDLLVGILGDEVVACDRDRRLRWRVPIGAGEIAGSLESVLVFRQGLNDWPTLCGLDPRNGAPTWRRPVSARLNLSGNNRLYGKEVFGERLFVFNEKDIGVFDCRTGRVMVNLPQNRNLIRRSYHMTAKLVRMAVSGNVLVVGFENVVFAMDLTPPSDVPEAFRADDPANAKRELDALARLDPNQPVGVDPLVSIGHNMADTPEMAPAILPRLRTALSRETAPEALDALVRAFCWIEDDELLRAAGRVMRSGIHPGDKICMVDILACHPAPEKGLAVLREIAAGGDAYAVEARGAAMKWLRLFGEKSDMNSEDLALLYSGDHGAAVAAFSRRLRETADGERAKLLKLIGMAADRVILELAGDLDRLPAAEREEGLRLVSQARARLEAMARVPTGE